MENRDSALKNLLAGLLVLLLLLTGVFLLKGWLEGHFISAETLRDYIKTFGALGPLMLILIQILQVLLPVLPGFLGCAVGAGLFGALGGFLCNYIGICAGSLAAFLLARHLGVKFVRKLVSEKQYDSCAEWIAAKKSYTTVLWLSILLPLAPDDFLCYFSGLTRMSFRKFAWIIVLAKPWCILLYSVFFGKLF